MSSICSSIAFFIHFRSSSANDGGEMGKDDESLNWHFSEFEWLVGDFFPALVVLCSNNNAETSFPEAP